MTRRDGSRGRASVARLLVVVGAVVGCGGGPGVEAPASATVAPGSVEFIPAFYTAEQAERGRRVFGSVCSVCHGRNEFTGPIFEFTWVAEPVGHLFQHVSASMPQDAPGSLSLAEYAAVVAYMLELNGREPGARELPADVEALNTMRW